MRFLRRLHLAEIPHHYGIFHGLSVRYSRQHGKPLSDLACAVVVLIVLQCCFVQPSLLASDGCLLEDIAGLRLSGLPGVDGHAHMSHLFAAVWCRCRFCLPQRQGIL